MRSGMTFVNSIAAAAAAVAALAVSPLATAAEATSAESPAPAASKPQGEHTLAELLTIATKREKEIREKVRDYTCLLVKRERINGRLQENRFIEIQVRTGGVRAGKKVPMAANMRFLAPAKVAGRHVIFVEGQNDGQMVVRRGGERFRNVVVNVDPLSDATKIESLMQITHLGLDGMASEIIKQIRRDMQADPTGGNTQVEIFRNAKVQGRVCTHVQITHPQRAKGLIYHLARIFVDDEYHLPIRVESHDWPKSAGAKPEVLGEFTYTKLKVNVGLSDAEFDANQLRTGAQ